MKTELLTCHRLTAGIVFPPVPLQHNIINKIYADVTERYPFQSLQHLPDGARMANPESDFFIQATRLQVNDQMEYFEAVKRKSVDLFAAAQARLQIPEFGTLGVKMTAFLPMTGEQNAAQLLERAAFSHIQDALDQLGDGRRGSGIRVVLHRDGVHDLRIEPFFGDLSRLYVELDIQHPEPFRDLGRVEEKMDAAYNYIQHEIAAFLEALA